MFRPCCKDFEISSIKYIDLFSIRFNMADRKNLMYGEHIHFLEASENECNTVETSVADLLAAKFSAEYSTIPISRPSHFLDTVKRIAALTRPSAVGK